MGQMIEVRPDLLIDSITNMEVEIPLMDFLPASLVLIGVLAVPLMYKFKLVSIL